MNTNLNIDEMKSSILFHSIAPKSNLELDQSGVSEMKEYVTLQQIFKSLEIPR